MATRTTIFATNDNVTADDLNALAGAWNSYNPTLSQGASTNINCTKTYCKYLQYGKLIICTISLSATATGSSGSAVTVSLPVTAAASALFVGGGSYLDFGTEWYPGNVWLASATTAVIVRSDGAVGTTNGVGSDPVLAVASGDAWYGHFMYEAA